MAQVDSSSSSSCSPTKPTEACATPGSLPQTPPTTEANAIPARQKPTEQHHSRMPQASQSKSSEASQPTTQSTAEREAKLKAEARAYALSGETREKTSKTKRKLPLPVGKTNTAAPRAPATTAERPQPHYLPAVHRVTQPDKKRAKITGAVKSATSTKPVAGIPKRSATKNATPTYYSTAPLQAKRQQVKLPLPPATQAFVANSSKIKAMSNPQHALTIPASSRMPQRSKVTAIPAAVGVPSSTTTKVSASKPKPSTTNFAPGASQPTTNPKTATSVKSANPNIKNYNDKYDPEYLKMIQSLGELDDFSIWDNLSDVEDVDFRLSDSEGDEFDDDEEDDFDMDIEMDEDEKSVPVRPERMAGAPTPLPEASSRSGKPIPGTGAQSGVHGPVSVTAPSSPTVENRAVAEAKTPCGALSGHNNSNGDGSADILSSPSLPILSGWGGKDKDNDDELYRNLEEELGGLLEEDLEAAVQSLYTTSAAASGEDSGKKKKGRKGAAGGAAVSSSKKQQQQQKQARNNQLQLPTQQNQASTAAFVATTVGTAPGGANTPVTAAILAAEAKRKAEEASKQAGAAGPKNHNQVRTGGNPGAKSPPDTPETPLRDAARHSRAAVTYKQSQQLRTLLRKHYQLLTQQAILSVRAAQYLKTGSGGSTASNHPSGAKTKSSANPPAAKATTPSTATTSPEKAKNKSGSGGGDFLSGENETDLTEILDLAVGMLQDLDQNRKDSIRTSIQLALTSNNNNSNGNANSITNAHEPKTSTSEAVNANEKSGGCGLGCNFDKGKHNASSGKASVENGGNSSGNGVASTGARRSLMSQFDEGEDNGKSHKKQQSQDNQHRNPNSFSVSSQLAPISNQGRLTRAAFRRLQAQPIAGSRRTAFDIPGLLKLDETFATIDDSVNIEANRNLSSTDGNNKSDENKDKKKTKKVNILEAVTHAQACRDALKDVGANVDEELLPGIMDLSENFSQLQEHLGDDFRPPCTPEQEQFLRKNRNLFTSGEDNLVLRGVNLYGEKQWILIGDRYLPDRSINIISQRYSKLCVMLYKAHGIYVDAKGNLVEPPKLESVDDIDETKVKAAGLKLVEPPAILNVHRWSMEEDLTILKAVPIMGHMWAELGARLIPHRDRGHLRKRYQVLERRVKAAITRGFKTAAKAKNGTKTASRSTCRASASKARSKTPAKAASKTIAKPTIGAAASKTMIAPKPSPPPTSASKVRASPGRSAKKAPLPAKSPSKTKSKAASTNPSPGVRAIASKAGSIEKNAVMSLESAAASLAGMQVNKIAAPKPSATPTLAPKRAILSKVTTASGSPYAPKQQTKPASYPQPKGQAQVEAGGTPSKFSSPPHPAHPVGSKNTPQHQHPPHPHYPYHYYPGYYHPHYPYPPHPGHPSNEKNKGQHPSTAQNGTPPHPPSTPKNYYPKPSFSAEGKRLNLASPKPSGGARPPKELNTPNNKSFMASIPKMVGEHLAAFSGDGDASRLAYEKLIEGIGGGNEDTQMSKLKKMMENEDENEAANAIVSHLAKSPGRGFSNLLSSPSKQPPSSPREVSTTSGLSIMARVLGNSSSNPKRKQAGVETTSDGPSKNLSSSSVSDYPKPFASPKKRQAGSFPGHGPLATAAPETPQRDPSSTNGFYSTSGTPLGLSPGLRSLGASALLKNDGIGSTSLTVPFSPAPNHGSQSGLLLKGGNEGTSTNFTVPYSPAPSMLFRAFDEKTGDENRFAFDHDHDGRVCGEDSNQQLGDLAVGADLSDTAHGVANTMNHPPPPNNGNSLIIAPDEFDAISGLGALSNSPFKTVKSLSQRDHDNDDGEEKKNSQKPTKSFFARVMGDSKEPSPQKKLF
ncbi:unnamed protein product [Pseudo-nitzschia multistriata]|uniref:Myb-like domain-containing protein n=1 Tax=Pseudo-nitzschia multistriata TaxID=183589 RepID=A0A448ZE01_9STRA|nr:unnamed protein product [Pseudo-nitzschia multistriata]